jgi:Tfp pilus assembly protein PilV
MNIKSPRSKTVRRQGITLIEVLVTGLLAMALILPLSRMGYLVVRNTQYANQSAEALAAGQSQLEVLENTEYGSIASGSSTSGDYSLTWTATETSGTKRVELVVSWTLAGSTQTLSLHTVYDDD